MNMDKIKKVHLVGIGGIGISALARFFLSHGVAVSGSDAKWSESLDKLFNIGIRVYTEHDFKFVPEDADIIVRSTAVGDDNPEIRAAKEAGIPTVNYPEALGMIMRSYCGIAVSGTNGKTTTTALLGHIFEQAGLDPTVIVGGSINSWSGNFRHGAGEFFIVEGCEYQRNMLSLNPKMIILTNIEADHLDYYKDISDIKTAFCDYVKKLPEDGALVYNKDDKNIKDILKCARSRKVSFSIKEDADICAKNIRAGGGAQTFSVFWKGRNVGEVRTSLPGEFNISNILGALACALQNEISADVAIEAVEKFQGVKRRFEYVKSIGGAKAVSDYAHHPSAVAGTLSAARSLYPDGKILAVFQPHQRDRTIKLFDEFTEAFCDADEIILSEIYEVLGRNDATAEISSKDIAQAIKDKYKKTVFYGKDIRETSRHVKSRAADFDIVVIMGAGDIDQIFKDI